jgi:hypothetical protein
MNNARDRAARPQLPTGHHRERKYGQATAYAQRAGSAAKGKGPTAAPRVYRPPVASDDANHTHGHRRGEPKTPSSTSRRQQGGDTTA